MKYVIFDIDGTIADCTHRLKYIQSKPKDYKKFYAECVHDEPIDDMIQLVMHMYRSGYEIVFCTGRSEVVRKETEEWLRKHLSGIYFELFMRETGSNVPDKIAKVKQMKDEGYTPDKVYAVFEDRDSVVEAYRVCGYRCLQVNKGDF
jgi:phosphoglycolate phosphatase-like HAD superfamily hydrolase